MAIEFHCPYCTATIRVPDQFAGKAGRCPKCDTKLIVPQIAPPPSAATPNNAATSPVAPAMPGMHQPSADVIGFSPPMSHTSAAAAAPLAGEAAAAEMPATVSAGSSASIPVVTRRRGRRRKRSSKFSWLVPVLCLGAFFLMLAGILSLRQAELKGVLHSNLAVAMEIPSVRVSLADMGLTPAEQAEVLTEFEHNSEAFVSAQMTCRVFGDGDHFAVEIKATEGFEWFTLNPLSDIPLSDWIRGHREELNRIRLQQITDAGAAMCHDKLQKVAGVPVVFDAERYRDSFALGSHVNAFGFAVEAVTGSRRSLCCHEDANGTLYFALPADTTSFKLRGRRIAGTSVWFPGEYTVEIRKSAAAAPTDAPPSEALPGETMPGETMPQDGSMTDPESTPDSQSPSGEPAMKPDTNSNESAATEMKMTPESG